ncbi:MAG: SdrD B-like domain-containing protein [Arachnia sp.]
MRWDPRQVNLAEAPAYRERSATIPRSVLKQPTGYLEDLRIGVSGGAGFIQGYMQPYLYDVPQELKDAVTIQYGYESTSAIWSTDNVADNEVSVGQNATECNNKAGRTWIDSTDNTALDAHINDLSMVRIVVDQLAWNLAYPGAIESSGGGQGSFAVNAGLMLSVNGQIGTDMQVNHDGQEVYIFSGRARGDWDLNAATSQPPTPSCLLIGNDDVTLDAGAPGNTRSPATNGWCSQGYDSAYESGAASAYTRLDPNAFTAPFGGVATSNTGTADSDADKVSIVAVRPAIEKTNLDGNLDIANNGETVDYQIDVSAYGADVEALTNVVMTDPMPAGYEFVEFLQDPSTPGATCGVVDVSGAQTVRCQFSEANPLVDTGPLPGGLPGGWRDTVKIRVRVAHASAALFSYAPITNTATINSSGLGAWDPTASVPGWREGAAPPNLTSPQSATSSAASYLPLGAAEGAIQKAVKGDPCTEVPEGFDGTLAQWQERCALTSWDYDSSNVAVDSNGTMTFTLAYSNTGNVKGTNMRIVDVLPFDGDGTIIEPASDSAADGASPSTVGDARTPSSVLAGDLGLVSLSGDLRTGTAYPQGYWVTNATPSQISRDPDAAIRDVTWCTFDGTTATQANTAEASSDAIGDCATLTSAYDVTAVYAFVRDALPDTTVSLDLVLDSENAACSDIWTNTFGARINDGTIDLPIRSNDVSIMTGCAPGVQVKKYDTNDGSDTISATFADGTTSTIYAGAHDAETPAKAVDLGAAGGTSDVRFTVTNTGTEPLVDVVVSDELTLGDATVSDMSCTFPGASQPTSGVQDADGNWSVTWVESVLDRNDPNADPAYLEPHQSFDCTATVSGVYTMHQDQSTVTGVGLGSLGQVTDSDNYNAFGKEPGIDIVKYDTSGAQTLTVNLADGTQRTIADGTARDANDDQSPADLTAAGGAESLSFTVTNTGTEDLAQVRVTDTITTGEASITELTCTFPGETSATAGQQDSETGDWAVTWGASFTDSPQVFPAGSSFGCTAELSGVADLSLHRDNSTVTGVGVGSNISVSDQDEYNAKVAIPRVDIEKYDTNGNETLSVTSSDGTSSQITDTAHDADSADSPVVLAANAVPVRFTVTNNGPEALVDTVVTDEVTAGNGSLTDMSCTFPGNDQPTAGVVSDGVWTVTWAENATALDEPALFEVGGSFDCTATVTGITSELHTDHATVTGKGALTAVGVQDSDDYNAERGSVSVGDYVWWDTNHNGIQDTGENGIKDAVLRLTGPDGEPVVDVDGTPVGTLTTGTNGAYSFDKLPILDEGQHYTVSVSAPEGYVPTKEHAIADTASDSSTGSADSQDLAADGDRDPRLDFGFWIPEPSIDIEKYDTFGNETLSAALADGTSSEITTSAHDADTADAAVDLTTRDGATSVSFTVTNTGTEDLIDVVVADTVTDGEASIAGMLCTFPGEDSPTAGVQNPETGDWSVAWAASASSSESPVPFAVAGSFDCTAQLSGVLVGDPHGDNTSVTGVGIQSGTSVDDTDAYHAKVEAPGIVIKKYDTKDGSDTLSVRLPDDSTAWSVEGVHDAETAAEAVVLQGSSVPVSFTIVNQGTEPLVDVVVGDTITGGGATVTDVSCAFPGNAQPTAGVQDSETGAWSITWAENAKALAEPALFEVGGSFDCTATVTGITSQVHADTSAVSAVGFSSGVTVTDEDPYHAKRGQVSVGDYVWWDANHNGVQDAREKGIGGVRVRLTGPDGEPVVDVDGNPVATTETDDKGRYSFDMLPILDEGQQYTVTVSDPAGYVSTRANASGDRATDSSTGAAASQGLTVDGDRDATLDFGYWIPEPSIDIEKYDTTGDQSLSVGLADGSTKVISTRAHDADTSDTAVDLTSADGAGELRFTLTNTGIEDLTDIAVTDELVAGGAHITAMKCTFPGESAPTAGSRSPLGAWRVEWAASKSGSRSSAVFGVGASFDCTAQLSGVEHGKQHVDRAAVTGVGVQSGTPVSDSDEYHARVAMRVPPLGDTGSQLTLSAVVAGLLLLIAGGALVVTGRRRRS